MIVYVPITQTIAKTHLSQLSLTCHPGLTDGGNIDFVLGNFRGDKSGTSMRYVCVIPGNTCADVPRGNVHTYFLLSCFDPHWKPARVKHSRQYLEQLFFSVLHTAGVSSAVLEKAAKKFRRLPNITSTPVIKEWPYSHSHLCAGLRLQLPVYSHLSLRRSPVLRKQDGIKVYLWVAVDFV